MDPTSRNRVWTVGGALIVIALLLVCGPLEGQFGGQRAGNSELDVAAAPPVPDVSMNAPSIASVGPVFDAALAGPSSGAAESSPLDDHPLMDDGVDVAAVAALPADGTGSTPTRAPSRSVVPSPQQLAANAAKQFDSSFPDSTSGLGDARNRFAPPVDSGPGGFRSPSGDLGFNALSLRPCDSPGAGCQNTQAQRRVVVTSTSVPVPGCD